MAGRRASYAQVLVETEAPIDLYKHLGRYWAVPNTPPGRPGLDGQPAPTQIPPRAPWPLWVSLSSRPCENLSSGRLTGSTNSPSLPLTASGKSQSYIPSSAWGIRGRLHGRRPLRYPRRDPRRRRPRGRPPRAAPPRFQLPLRGDPEVGFRRPPGRAQVESSSGFRGNRTPGRGR